WFTEVLSGVSHDLLCCRERAGTRRHPLCLHDALPISCNSRPMRCCSSRVESRTSRSRFLRSVMSRAIIDTATCLPRTSSIGDIRSEEHTSELQSRENLVCRLLLEKKNEINKPEVHPRE